jgi:hypothetical protein
MIRGCRLRRDSADGQGAVVSPGVVSCTGDDVGLRSSIVRRQPPSRHRGTSDPVHSGRTLDSWPSRKSWMGLLLGNRIVRPMHCPCRARSFDVYARAIAPAVYSAALAVPSAGRSCQARDCLRYAMRSDRT